MKFSSRLENKNKEKFELTSDKSNNLLLLKLTSGMLKNRLLPNLENFTSHCLKNPEILLVMLIRPLLIRPYCV